MTTEITHEETVVAETAAETVPTAAEPAAATTEPDGTGTDTETGTDTGHTVGSGPKRVQPENWTNP